MGLFDIFKKKKQEVAQAPTPQPSSNYINGGVSTGMSVPMVFDGEVDLGEMGVAKNFVIDYNTLRIRSKQMYLESDLIHTVVRRKNTWKIGNGLDLQCRINSMVLESEGIKINAQELSKTVESRFKAWANSEASSWVGNKNFNRLQSEAGMRQSMDGDLLVILRYDNDRLQVQHIDACNVQNPIFVSMLPNENKVNNSTGYDYVWTNGNRLRNGVEIDSNGVIVAYHVRVGIGVDTERVKAKNRYGMTMAFMLLADEFNTDSYRGIPDCSSNMENAAMLKRLKEAAIGGYEERQKIAYYSETAPDGVEGDIFNANNLAKEYSGLGGGAYGDDKNDLPVDVNGVYMNNTISSTKAKNVKQLPKGQTIKAFGESQDMHFNEFYTPIAESQASTLGMPPEVAFMKYGGSFSSSRAGLKDWEHTLMVDRYAYAIQYNQRIYAVWFLLEVLNNKIDAKGFLKAWLSDNYMVVSAYLSASWVGANVPHIDPVKEVKAEREKLGGLAVNAPLTSIEASTMALNGGEYRDNVQQFALELQEMTQNGLQIEPFGKEEMESDNEEEDKKEEKD